MAGRLGVSRLPVREALRRRATGMEQHRHGAISLLFLTSHSPLFAVVCVSAIFGLVAGFGNVSNQTALYVEAPAEKVGTASGLLRTFGYMGSIAAATITGIAFRARVSDPGLHVVAAILVGIGIVVLIMTVLDRQIGTAPASRPISSASSPARVTCRVRRLLSPPASRPSSAPAARAASSISTAAGFAPSPVTPQPSRAAISSSGSATRSSARPARWER